MNTKPNALDFEREFLASVLQMLGDRLSALHSNVDWDPPEESYLFDPMEHLAGVAVVAVQRYMASVCNWLKVDRLTALLWGPKRKGIAIASVLNAAANYWKHVEDGTPIRKQTREVLEQIGLTLDSSYCVTNALYECGYENLTGLMDDLVRWRDAVAEKRQELPE
jgi:hypothetical protein